VALVVRKLLRASRGHRVESRSVPSMPGKSCAARDFLDDYLDVGAASAPTARFVRRFRAVARLDRLFCTITPPEAELIRLVLEGRPWDEIAARMGVNNSVIRARWADLRTRLRTMVEAMLRERRN